MEGSFFCRLRKFSRSIFGEELVDWFLNHQVTSTREQACVIGQALLDAGLIKSVADDKVRRKFCNCLIEQASFIT